jgi:6-pyruvoyltetrahydropterin/6-carboxytetrahydropterin synthase
MFMISKDFTFSAAHALPSLPATHKCHRMHGHNYEVRIEVSSSEVDEHGMVLDYAELNPVGTYLDDTFDHRTIELAPATAEVLARHIHGVTTRLLAAWPVSIAVGVSETPRCWAWYR